METDIEKSHELLGWNQRIRYLSNDFSYLPFSILPYGALLLSTEIWPEKAFDSFT